MLLLKTLTPLHVGASDGNGTVDVPIQREKAKGIPKVDATTIKGELMGNEKSDGSIVFSDLKLLFFPMKASRNIYSLISCPYILNRLYDQCYWNNIDSYDDGLKRMLLEVQNIKTGFAYVFDSDDKKICIGEYIFKCKKVDNNGFLEKFKNRMVILADSDFIELISNNTEITTRNRIDDNTKNTINSALFTQEFLPSEAILYGFINYFKNITHEKQGVFDDFLNKVDSKHKFRLGGNRSLGKGIIEIIG